MAQCDGRQLGSAGLPHEPRGQSRDQREEVRRQHLDPLVRLREQQPVGLHRHFRPNIIPYDYGGDKNDDDDDDDDGDDKNSNFSSFDTQTTHIVPPMSYCLGCK